jgi:hypothetical protein
MAIDFLTTDINAGLSIPSTRMTIDYNGNVGIGTTAPLSKLGVLGNLSVGATYGAIAAPTSGAIIEGNVGIGISAPSSAHKVSIADIGTNNGGVSMNINKTGVVIGASYGIASNVSGAGTTNVGIYLSASGATNNYALVVPSTGGNVGIGTTAPLAKLAITQTATATGVVKGLIYTGAINTNQTLSTEIPSATFTTAGRQWATGAITLQREFLITAPTYSFVGASTITDAVTLGVTAPVAGTNATLTRSWAAQFTGNTAVSTNLMVGSLTTAPADPLHVIGNIRTSSLAGTGDRPVKANANGVLGIETDATIIYTKKVSLTSAQILTLGTTAITAIPLVTGKTIRIISASAKLNYNSTAYGATTNIFFSTGANSQYMFCDILNATATTHRYFINTGLSGAVGTELLDATAVLIGTSGVNPTLGNSTIDLYITYELITL